MGNEATRWKPGQSGNPAGRPKGIDIVKIVKDKLEEVPEGEKRSRGEQLADIIIDKMIADGNERTIEDTLDRLYGKARQTIDANVTGPERYLVGPMSGFEGDRPDVAPMGEQEEVSDS